MTVAAFVGLISLAIWTYLLFLRGGFWRVRLDEPHCRLESAPVRRVAIVVPARNEADGVGQAVRSLLLQDYPGRSHVFLVDDHSSDGTAEIARRAAEQSRCPERLTIVPAKPLPGGWTGKLWAVSEGIRAAAPFNADYYWFTDADVVHEPDNLTGLMARAEKGGFDLVSLMVKLHCASLAERMLIPAFIFFFFKLYPPSWVARSDKRTAAAAGGCILIRAGALARIGGIGAIRDQLIDDCALARAVKPGGRVWLGLTTRARSLRAYGSWSEIGRMISRSAFTQLNHSAILLGGVVAGMAVTYLAPPLLVAFGTWTAAAFGLVTWLLMVIAYGPTLRLYGVSRWWGLLLPLTAAFYLGATVRSAVQYWRGRGGMWKDRIQDPAATAAVNERG